MGAYYSKTARIHYITRRSGLAMMGSSIPGDNVNIQSEIEKTPKQTKS